MAEITNQTGRVKLVKKDGVFYMLSNETKPSINDGVGDGDSLLWVDSGQIFIYYKGVWREQ